MTKAPGTRPLQPWEEQRILDLLAQGHSVASVADQIERHGDTVRAFLKRKRIDPLQVVPLGEVPAPIPHDRLCAEAQRALEDYGYFRLRYFGHRSRPWMVEAAVELVTLLESPNREYVVYNAPSGAGKTTDKIDFAAWLTVRDRAIRGLFGSYVATNAIRDLKRLRRAFERTVPAKATDYDLRYGTGVDAEASLALDFGRFQPLERDTWRDDSVVVEQMHSRGITEREPTWSAYGVDSGVLSNRFNFCDWDDLVTKATLRTLEARKNLEHVWDTELESRLEPAGLHCLRGQRMDPGDLFRYNLDKVTEELDEDEEGNEVVVATKPKYVHICYPAHDQSRCLSGAKGSHRRTALPWPQGCLLEPVRLPWADLRGVMLNNPRAFALMYQQEDVEAADALVAQAWIDGTTDDDGVHPGCLDVDRHFRELPAGIRGPLLSVATVDPAGSKYWGIEWWVYAAPSNLRILFDLVNEKLEAPDLLDWNADAEEHTGVMEEWQQASVDLGVPITHWVIEENTTQKWLYQYAHFKSWMRRWPSVSVLPHSTGHRKLDAALGVPTLGPLYRAGLVRLPWARSAQPMTSRLTTQLTRWSLEIAHAGGKQLEDLVMANWFLEVKLEGLKPRVITPAATHLFRPSWMTGRRGPVPESAWQGAESEYEAQLRARRGA